MKIITMGNALVDVMTMLENDNILDSLNIEKASMELVNYEKSRQIMEITKNLKSSYSCGGSAANTARGLAKLGVKTAYLGKIGNDEIGAFFKKDTLKAGVSPLIFESPTPTGISVVMVSKDSERTFATFLGAAAELETKNISEKIFEDYDLLHIEGYLVFNNELIKKAVKTAKNSGLKVSLDLASYNVVEHNLDFLKEIVSEYVDIVFANEEEAKAFTGEDPEEAINKIADICETAIVKVGRKGSYIKSGSFFHKQDSEQVKSIDTTGAGDYYAAGFLYGLSQNQTYDKCAEMGTLLASNIIKTIGTKLDEITWETIISKVK